MTATDNKGLLSCTGICWLLSAAFGALVVYFLVAFTDIAFLLALIVGLIGVLGADWVLSSYFCVGAAAPEALTPAGTDVIAQTETPDGTMVEPARADDVTDVAAETVPAQAAAVADIPTQQPEGLTAAQGDKPALYTAAPVARDDLQKIKGVGPALERTLNDLGIYTYAQIAEWDAGNIAWVDGNLKFKGRITRDDWVVQAKTLSLASDG